MFVILPKKKLMMLLGSQKILRRIHPVVFKISQTSFSHFLFSTSQCKNVVCTSKMSSASNRPAPAGQANLKWSEVLGNCPSTLIIYYSHEQDEGTQQNTEAFSVVMAVVKVPSFAWKPPSPKSSPECSSKCVSTEIYLVDVRFQAKTALQNVWLRRSTW